jgi:ubiquinone/menaquinone biosynthesis C-methylase UbiE
MTAPVSDHWDDNAQFWVNIIRERRDRYRTGLTDEAILTLIGAYENLDVLDVGCGEGYMARELVNRGARHVDGIDKSAALIAAARSAEIPAARFGEGDAADLPFSPESFDLVLANHLLNNLRDIKLPISEFARVLRPSGRLIALIRHPCFYGYRRTLAWTDYFSQRAIEHPFRVDGLTSPATAVTWLRPLEAYAEAITGSGLYLTKLTEPHPSEEQLSMSEWWRENFPRPLFLLIAAQKAG